MFWPDDSESAYLAYVFRYTDTYLRKKQVPVEENIHEFMVKYIQLDLEDTIDCYNSFNQPFQIYIPPNHSIEKLVEVDISYEEKHDNKTTE